MSWTDDCWSWTEEMPEDGREVCGPCHKAARIYGGPQHEVGDDEDDS